MTPTSYEEKKQQHEREKAMNRKHMAELCTDLKETLSHGSCRGYRLDAQAQILDELFFALMKENIRNDINRGYFSDRNLAHILHIQKQCMETIKASQAIEYMQKLTFYRPQPPSPLNLHKQSEEPWNLEK